MRLSRRYDRASPSREHERNLLLSHGYRLGRSSSLPEGLVEVWYERINAWKSEDWQAGDDETAVRARMEARIQREAAEAERRRREALEKNDEFQLSDAASRKPKRRVESRRVANSKRRKRGGRRMSANGRRRKRSAAWPRRFGYAPRRKRVVDWHKTHVVALTKSGDGPRRHSERSRAPTALTQ